MLEHFEKFESYIPFDLNLIENTIISSIVLYLIIVSRYLILVGAFHWYFWRKGNTTKLYSKKASRQQVLFEIKWSLISSLFFALAGVLIGLLWQNGNTSIYLKLDKYGIWYLPLSILIIAIFHEIYFYFTHRLLHISKIYKIAHSVHHKSLNPSAWASLSFHPLEAFLEAMILPLIFLMVPVHPLIILIYLLLMTVSAIINHLGVEIFAGKFSFLRRFIISGTHHHKHHSKFNYNFGLYFTFMDSLMGTEYKGK